ncbi:major capsid protein [Vibrio parahaemolyticus]|nr:major capsid protein [Vibrio parahaemolyticus]MCZ5878208.1 major capsid protein [Vibrio parahaemolyticus]MCZ6372396.1 major capsid protein [Vibrio parahaemolyticus]MDF4503353.1 major capsid protein [Vibrio parahaemolyticus]MDG2809552.1 major capsid protein [Vibrio parahaemolyticus]MDG3428178.1 major capsid protein [Vibrio parahaemolyticus]
MDIIDLFRSYTKLDVWGEFLNKQKKLKPVPMPVRNTVFGPAQLWHDVSLPYSEIKDTTTNVPVVRRGTAALVLKSEGTTVKAIEPQGFVMSHFATAAELNNLKALGMKATKQWFDSKNANMLRRVYKGIEAMCAMALSGKVEYPMKAEGGEIELEVYDYGLTEEYSAAGTIDVSSTDTTISQLFKLLQSMAGKIEDNGYGSKLLTYAGRDIYARIMDIASGTNTRNISIEIAENEITIGGYKIQRMSGKYHTYVGGAKTMVDKIDAEALCMIDLDAGHDFYYLAIDDLDAGLKALPFFSKPLKSENPNGAEIIGHSKPVPVPVVAAICWCNDAMGGGA